MGGREKRQHIPERFLRQLWKQQAFDVKHLETTDGKRVEIISPGTTNTDGGPDFLDARIRIGGVLHSGDVELHQGAREWLEHSHHHDAKYNSVILHVVFRGPESAITSRTASRRIVPVLILEHHLNASYHTLWNEMILGERAERLRLIRCYQGNHIVPTETIHAWLHKLAIERLELKLRRFEDRLTELVDEQRLSVQEPPSRYDDIPFGINPEELPAPQHHYAQTDFAKRRLWEQVLYEGMMEALGYSKNRGPFLRLARSLRLNFFDQHLPSAPPNETETMYEGVLFGVAGLLLSPESASDPDARTRLKQASRWWNQARQSYRGEILQQSDWQFFRLRPENFPTLRLAGAARLLPRLLTGVIFRSIIQILKHEETKPGENVRRLQELFVVPADTFWMYHYRFDERATRPLTAIIGRNRANDIILNIILPLSLLYARIFKDREVRSGCLRIFEGFQPLSDNTITRTIDTQLINNRFEIEHAWQQQGALQLYKLYCVDERCGECAVGKIVFGS